MTTPAVTAAHRIDEISRRAAGSLPAIPRPGKPVFCIVPIEDMATLIDLSRAGLELRTEGLEQWGYGDAIDAYDVRLRAALLLDDARSLLGKLDDAERKIAEASAWEPGT